MLIRRKQSPQIFNKWLFVYLPKILLFLPQNIYIASQEAFLPHYNWTNMKRFDELRDMVMSLEGDFEKFYDKENQAAGTRVRKGMQDLKNLAQEIRIEVQDIKNKA